MLHQQAKELRRQSQQERQFGGESLFQEVNLQPFESQDQSFSRQFTSQDDSQDLTVFSNRRKQPVERQPSPLLSTKFEPTSKPRIRFPSIKLKAEVPVIDLNSDLKTNSPQVRENLQLQSGSRLAFELFLKSKDSETPNLSVTSFIPTPAPQDQEIVTQPIFSLQDPPKQSLFQTPGNFRRPSQEALSLLDSIQNRLNEERTVIEDNKDQRTQFPNFQRQDPNIIQGGAQERRLVTNSEDAEERERNLKILQAVAGDGAISRTRVDIDSENAEEERRRKLVGEKRRKQLFNVERKRLRDKMRTRFRTTSRPRTSVTNSNRLITTPITRQREREKTVSEKDVVNDARKVILDRVASDSVKDSDLVWAAIKTIDNFIKVQERVDNNQEAPREILMAIMQLTKFIKEETGEDKEEEEESMRAINVFVDAKVKNKKIPTTITRPPAPRVINKGEIFTNRDTFDIYTDEAIIANDYEFDYESEKDVQFKFRFRPSSKIQTERPAAKDFNKQIILSKQLEERGNQGEERLFSLQRSSSFQTKPNTPKFDFKEEGDDRFKLKFDPTTGLFSTSVEQFQNKEDVFESVPKEQQILPDHFHNIKRPKFEIFTLPV